MRSIFKYYLFFLLVLLVSCGVKKNVADNQEPVASTLEQRIASGEFSWLDTIQIETEDNDQRIRGPYRLTEKRHLNDKRTDISNFWADSIVFLPDGHYEMYKSDILIDYGRYNARMFKNIQICKENYPVPLSNPGYYSIVSLYSISGDEMQYVVVVGLGGIALDISFRYKFCDYSYNPQKDFYRTRWTTADANVLENLKRNQQHIDSLSNTIPIFNGF